jgi:hypothetical protein
MGRIAQLRHWRLRRNIQAPYGSRWCQPKGMGETSASAVDSSPAVGPNSWPVALKDS